MKKEINLDQYFCISLESCQGMFSIYEHRKLSSNQYHRCDFVNKGIYKRLREVEKENGRRIYSWNLFPERYQDYEFEMTEYQVNNDAIVDGFEYDSKNEIIVYESIYGLYAVSDGEIYYDVMTGEEIPWYAVGSVEEVLKPKQFQNMMEDLKIIKKHMPAYIKMLDEIFLKLKKGAENRELAAKRYEENYMRMKREENQKWIESQRKIKNMEKQFRIESTSQREIARQLIYQIRNGNETYYRRK